MWRLGLAGTVRGSTPGRAPDPLQDVSKRMTATSSASPTGRPLQFAVIHHEDMWRLLRDGERLGRFRTWDAARACAVRLYEDAAGRGEEAELLIQDRFGQLREGGRAA